MRRGIDPDSIPRYEIPEQVFYEQDDEPEYGACWNCCHAVDVMVNGRSYMLCVSERDMTGDGDVTECDVSVRECKEWDEA